MSGIIAFFRASPPKAGAAFDEHRFRRVRWQTFIAMTLAYVTFYVCRLSFTVAKSALVELGITPTELGMIGSTLFFSYAIGKLVNGFIADHANVVRYMSLGLLLSAGMNLMMGMTTNALLLAIFWGINGWAQSMGVGPCAVSLARWYGVKERGTFYGIWSTAHNIGEAVTYMVIAAVIAGFGWQMGYLSTAALGAAGVVLLVLFMHDSPQSSGFPSINVIRDEPQEEVEARGSVFKNQLLALRNPALWTLALASAFMYIDRYAVNSCCCSVTPCGRRISLRSRQTGLSSSVPRSKSDVKKALPLRRAFCFSLRLLCPVAASRNVSMAITFLSSGDGFLLTH